MNDATVLLRDIAGDAATNTASRVRPDEEKLSQIDRPADDNTWHDAPDLSKDNLRKQLQNSYKGNNPTEDANAVVDNAAQATQSTGDPYGGLDSAKQTAQERTGISEEDKEKVKQASKRRAEEYRARTKEYLSKKMPQERREQTIWRLKVSLSTSPTRSFLRRFRY